MSFNLLAVSGKKRHGKDTLGNFVLDEVAKKHGALIVRKNFADNVKEEVANLLSSWEVLSSVAGNGNYHTDVERDMQENGYIYEQVVVHLQEHICPSQTISDITRTLKQGLSMLHSGVGLPVDSVLKSKWRDDLMNSDECKVKHRILLQWYGTEFRRKFSGEDYWVRRVLNLYDSVCENKVAGKFVLGIFDVRFPNELNALLEIRNSLCVRVVRSGVESEDNHPSETALDDETRWHSVVYNDGTIDDLREKATKLVDDFYTKAQRKVSYSP